MESEPLKPEEFDAHIHNSTLRLALVGMSNAGKSYRAKILRNENGFSWYNVDEEIRKALGLAIVEDLSDWLGYPSSPDYVLREKEYLALENGFTRSAAELDSGQNLVFDTTGSVVHLSDETLGILRENTLIVHLDVGESSLSELIERFFATPKPVAWDGFFTQLPGENETDALKRSYPALLSARLEKYRRLAHINVPARSVREKSGSETLAIIRKHLL